MLVSMAGGRLHYTRKPEATKVEIAASFKHLFSMSALAGNKYHKMFPFNYGLFCSF